MESCPHSIWAAAKRRGREKLEDNLGKWTARTCHSCQTDGLPTMAGGVSSAGICRHYHHRGVELNYLAGRHWKWSRRRRRWSWKFGGNCRAHISIVSLRLCATTIVREDSHIVVRRTVVGWDVEAPTIRNPIMSVSSFDTLLKPTRGI